MAWTASVVGKTFINGVVTVTLEFSDGTTTLQKQFSTDRPWQSWIPDLVQSELARLDVAKSFDIPLGPVTPSAVVSDPNLELFRKRAALLAIVKMMIDLEVVSPTNAKVVALINWIKANLDAYFEKL